MRRDGLAMWWGIAAVVSLALASCNGPTPERNGVRPVPAHRLTVTVDLRTTRALAGHPINGMLIVENPGGAINLTKIVKGGCEPGFAVFLRQGAFSNAEGFDAVCTNKPFVIASGRTTLPFSV